MRLDLNHLRHALAVTRCRSFSRAAAELNLTQPALSRSIAAFEQRYGLRLFERAPGGVVPTAIGALVIEEAERLLTTAQDLDHNLSLYGRGEAGRISIGLGPLAASLILPRLSSDLFRERPRLHLRTVIKPPDELFEALVANEIEMVFANSWKVREHPGLTISPMGSIRFAMIVRRAHPLAKKRRLTLASLENFPLASPVEFPMRGLLRGSAMFICDNFHILRETTLHSDCVWLASPDLVSADLAARRLCTLAFSDFDDPHNEISLISRRGRSLSPAAEAVVRSARLICAPLGSNS